MVEGIIYGILLLIVFLLGVLSGIGIPFLIKKYISLELQKNNSFNNSDIESNEKPSTLTADVIDEWQNGGNDNE